MEQLKLLALDADDLKVLSAHVQDAVLKVEDLDFRAGEKRFILPMYRFAWEKTVARRGGDERRNSVLDFGRVLSVRLSGIDRKDGDQVLSLLAVDFHPQEAPAGTVELVFAGNAAIRLGVECIEARLSDLGGAWQASSRPRHTA